MHSPRTVHLILLLAIVIVGAVQSGGSNVSQVQSAAQEPEKKTAQTTEKELHEIEVRYAKVFDDLARVNLRAAEELNQKVAGMFSNSYMNRLRELVTIADDRFEALQQNSPLENVRLIRAKLDLNVAERNLQRAMDANKQSPGAMTTASIDRLRLHRDLAQINLDRSKLAAESPNPMADMQWQIDRLQDTVWELRSSIDAITSRR